MWVDRGTFQPMMARVERLLPVEVHDLNRLYQLGFAAWLPSSAIAEGVYYGIRVNGRLVAAAGTHVVSREAGLAVVGNVLTHADHRGRGYAKAVTSAVTAELLRYCDQVVLNVRADNPPAIAAYRRLGYAGALPVRGAARPPDHPGLAGPHRPVPPPVRRPPSESARRPPSTRPTPCADRRPRPSDPPPAPPEAGAPTEEPR